MPIESSIVVDSDSEPKEQPAREKITLMLRQNESWMAQRCTKIRQNVSFIFLRRLLQQTIFLIAC
jgi:hypothetical protein